MYSFLTSRQTNEIHTLQLASCQRRNGDVKTTTEWRVWNLKQATNILHPTNVNLHALVKQQNCWKCLH